MVVAGAVLTMLFLKVTSRTESLAAFVFNIHIHFFLLSQKTVTNVFLGCFILNLSLSLLFE